MPQQSSKTVNRCRTWVFSAFMAVFVLAGCSQQGEYMAPPPPEVTVSKPVERAVTDYAEYTGTTEAVESVEIRARVEGYLESIHFQPGSRVQKGDLLFVIDPKPYQARLDEAKAELQRRKAELEQAEATLKRKELAYRAKAISEVEIIQSKADRDVAKAAIQAALAAIEMAQLNLSYTKIHAPISGRIGRNLLDVGNLVGAGERTLLTTITNDDPIYAYFNINERDLLHYQDHYGQDSPTNGNGQTQIYLGLSTQRDYPFEGRMDYVDNRLDPSTGTIQVRGVFSNVDRLLWPGLFARIRVPISNRENALLVPDVALGADQRGAYLLLVDDKNVVEHRSVTAGALVGEMRVIEEGLTSDDRVIVSGLQRARPGVTVNPVEAPAQLSASDRKTETSK